VPGAAWHAYSSAWRRVDVIGVRLSKTQYDALASAGAYPLLSSSSLLMIGAIAVLLGLALRVTAKGISDRRR
jgi:hypothetical protein